MYTTHNKEEVLLVYNKQQETNYYLSTTNNKEELLPVYNKKGKKILPIYRKEKLLPIYNTQQRRNVTCLKHATKRNYYQFTTKNK